MMPKSDVRGCPLGSVSKCETLDSRQRQGLVPLYYGILWNPRRNSVGLYVQILKENQEWHCLPGFWPPMFMEHKSVGHKGGPGGDKVRSQTSSLSSLSFSLLSEKINKKTDTVTPGWGQRQGPPGKPHRRT